jgi:BirA family biotin operon repressor/biotin-[acetyl-CoA-carboxylase] ligase
MMDEVHRAGLSELSAARISRALGTRRLGHPTLCFPTIGSTNDVAHEQARAGAVDGTLVLADEQTAGRGRLDRRWWAPAGTCLLMSLLLRPVLALARAGELAMCLGLGAVEGIETVTGVRAALKWPNDVLLHERKLGGMLAELRVDNNRLEYAVLGLGLNVNVDFHAPLMAPSRAADGRSPRPDALRSSDPSTEVPPEVAASATSLLAALGQPVDRIALLAAILAHTEAWYDRMLAGASPHAAWARRLDTLGRRVIVSLAAGALTGLATGVTPEGALLITDDSGQSHTVWSGDVASVRAYEGLAV